MEILFQERAVFEKNNLVDLFKIIVFYNLCPPRAAGTHECFTLGVLLHDFDPLCAAATRGGQNPS
ncbi:hypothetical protein Hdeb2414_s0002g00046111 [Helianthus debilis subsp. tardiflorus]